MSIKALSDYTIHSRYAKYIPEKKRRETWVEQVDRVMQMHIDKYGGENGILFSTPEMNDLYATNKPNHLHTKPYQSGHDFLVNKDLTLILQCQPLL